MIQLNKYEFSVGSSESETSVIAAPILDTPLSVDHAPLDKDAEADAVAVVDEEATPLPPTTTTTITATTALVVVDKASGEDNSDDSESDSWMRASTPHFDDAIMLLVNEGGCYDVDSEDEELDVSTAYWMDRVEKCLDQSESGDNDDTANSCQSLMKEAKKPAIAKVNR